MMMRTTFLATLAGVASAQKIDPLSACCKQTHPLSSPVVALDTWVYFTDNIGSDNWNTRVTSYEKACCPKPADCPGGVPKVCSEKCATIFQPFYRDCFKTFDQQSQKNMIKVHKLCGDTGFITVALGAHNGVRAHNYVFKIAKLKRPTYASYSSQMIRACSKLSMKPVCDHPSYCRADDKALYIGNDNHIAYKPHRNTLKYHAKGWERIKDKWVGLCSYTGSAGGSKDQNAKNGALCNIPVNTHSWKSAKAANVGFMCGRENTKTAESDLKYVQITWAGGNGCKGNHNKDAQSKTGVWCATAERHGLVSRKCRDSNTNQLFRMEHISGALFMGKKQADKQVGSYRLHSRRRDYMCLAYGAGKCGAYKWERCKKSPGSKDNQVFHLSNFLDDLDDSDVFNWAGYNGRAMDAAGCKGFVNGNPIRHCTDNMKMGKRWQMMVTDIPLKVWRADIGNSLGTADHEYEFQIASLGRNRKGTYSSLMIKACKRYDMKPICGHPSYCKTDDKSIYLGNKNHLSVSDRDLIALVAV